MASAIWTNCGATKERLSLASMRDRIASPFVGMKTVIAAHRQSLLDSLRSAVHQHPRYSARQGCICFVREIVERDYPMGRAAELATTATK